MFNTFYHHLLYSVKKSPQNLKIYLQKLIYTLFVLDPPVMSSNKLIPSSSNHDIHQPIIKRRRITRIHQIYPLPLDIIIKIFTHLDNFEDFKKCMGLCKEIRDYIFKTPKIMRKIPSRLEHVYIFYRIERRIFQLTYLKSLF